MDCFRTDAEEDLDIELAQVDRDAVRTLGVRALDNRALYTAVVILRWHPWCLVELGSRCIGLWTSWKLYSYMEMLEDDGRVVVVVAKNLLSACSNSNPSCPCSSSRELDWLPGRLRTRLVKENNVGIGKRLRHTYSFFQAPPRPPLGKGQPLIIRSENWKKGSDSDC